MTFDLNDPRAWLLTWESGDTAVWLERPNLNPEIKVQPLYLAQTPAYLEDLAQWADAAVELFPVHGERFQEIARVLRTALRGDAQTGRNRDPIYAPDGKTWYQTALDEASKRGETELRIHELEAVDESIAKQLQRSIERNSRLVNRVKALESFCTNSAKHVTDGEVFAGHIADCCRKIALDEGTP